LNNSAILKPGSVLTYWVSICTTIGYSTFDYPANENFRQVYGEELQKVYWIS